MRYEVKVTRVHTYIVDGWAAARDGWEVNNTEDAIDYVIDADLTPDDEETTDMRCEEIYEGPDNRADLEPPTPRECACGCGVVRGRTAAEEVL